jgi:hypothetical protein
MTLRPTANQAVVKGTKLHEIHPAGPVAGLLTQRVLIFRTTIQPPYSLLKTDHPLQAPGLLTQGVPGVPQDPLAPRGEPVWILSLGSLG